MFHSKKAEEYTTFDWLLRNLDIVIENYIKLGDKDPHEKVSFQNGAAEYRLHYEAGPEGVQRAQLYRRKIQAYIDEESLVKAVLADCEAAFLQANNKTMVNQMTKVAGQAYKSVLSMWARPSESAEVGKILHMPADTDANLGDSEVLRDMLVRRLFEHYHLSLDDKGYFDKTKIMDPARVAVNAKKYPERQFNAIKEHVAKKWPEEKMSENRQWHQFS